MEGGEKGRRAEGVSAKEKRHEGKREEGTRTWESRNHPMRKLARIPMTAVTREATALKRGKRRGQLKRTLLFHRSFAAHLARTLK